MLNVFFAQFECWIKKKNINGCCERGMEEQRYEDSFNFF